MAEQDDAQERTESATDKRLEEARKQGQIPRSKELNSAAVTVLSCAAISLFGEGMAKSLMQMMRSGLSIQFSIHSSPSLMVAALMQDLASGFVAVLPVMGAGFMAALLAPMALSGWNFSMQALMPDFAKLNPISGLGRVFSVSGFIELIKSIFKFLVVGVFAWCTLKHHTGHLMDLGNHSLPAAIASAAHICSSALLVISCGLLLLAAVDVPLQLWQFNKKMRMSREEIKQEMKENEGSPEVKGRIRRMQQEAARARMMTEVPKADVIVTNPTHFAVALRYDDKKHRAPIVVAKGVDLVAARIREIATEHSVPIFEAPPLARVLYRHVELGHEIPGTLYVAVAQVLTYIFQLRAYRKGQSIYPDKPVIAVDEDSYKRH